MRIVSSAAENLTVDSSTLLAFEGGGVAFLAAVRCMGLDSLENLPSGLVSPYHITSPRTFPLHLLGKDGLFFPGLGLEIMGSSVAHGKIALDQLDMSVNNAIHNIGKYLIQTSSSVYLQSRTLPDSSRVSIYYLVDIKSPHGVSEQHPLIQQSCSCPWTAHQRSS